MVSCRPEGQEQNPDREDVMVELYDYSGKLSPSSYFSVDVNGQSAMVIETVEQDVCTFGADGPVTVSVGAWREMISSALVRPQSKEIPFELVNGKVQLTLQPYDQVVVEINGNAKKCLCIFVNPIEENKPSPEGTNVIYRKAGSLYDENITLLSGQTLYIEGGAVVRGCITAAVGSENISILGCGILDARDKSTRGIQINQVSNLTIEGLTLINNNNWSTLIAASEDISINNYKVVAVKSTMTESGKENDALDLLGCKNAAVTKCFGYAHDDVFCIKSHKWDYKGVVDNIRFEDCTAWNVYGGNSFVIGAEVNENVMNVTYRNCCSIHCAGEEANKAMYRGGISVHNCAGGTVSDILFENITLEECGEFGICLDIRKSYVSNLGNGVEYTPGYCDGITVRNVQMLGAPRFGNLIKGKDDEHSIKNVILENITQEGVKLQSSDIGDKISVSYADCTVK